MPPVVVVSILPENGYGRPLGVVDYLAKPVRGSLLRERVARALASGAHAYVVKPFSPRELVDRVNEMLR